MAYEELGIQGLCVFTIKKSDVIDSYTDSINAGHNILAIDQDWTVWAISQSHMQNSSTFGKIYLFTTIFVLSDREDGCKNCYMIEDGKIYLREHCVSTLFDVSFLNQL